MAKNLYNKAFLINTDIKNTSFDYITDGALLRKTCSPYIFQNEILSGFLDLISLMMANNVEAVKKIRIHNNFAVDKETTYIN